MRHSILSFVTVLSLSAPAFAGFEWVPPHDNPTAPTYVAPAQPTPPSPELIQSIRMHEKQAPAPKRQLPDVTLMDITEPTVYQDVMPAPAMVMPKPISAPKPAPAPAPMPVATNMPAPYSAAGNNALTINPAPTQNAPSQFTKNVSGFGDDLPLALALAELVPPNFSYAFGAGVNPGASVSWDGKGRPWPTVIAEMLRPADMAVSFRGSILIISSAPKNIVMQAPNANNRTSMTQAPIAARRITPIAVQAPAIAPRMAISSAPRRRAPTNSFNDDGFMPMPGNTNKGNAPVQLVPLPNP